MKSNTKTFLTMAVLLSLSLITIIVYLTIQSNGNWNYILPLRGKKLLAFVIVSISSTVGTMVFQTITQNHILTPSIVGLDAIFVFFQTVIMFSFGNSHGIVQNDYLNFFLSASLMVGTSCLLYWVFFKKYPGRLYLLLMTGLIVGTFFRSFTSFLQVVMDPNEFNQLQGRLFASFNNVDTVLLAISFAISLPLLTIFFRKAPILDVLHLGRTNALGLGIDVDRLNLFLFILISILTAVSTALVGPVAFLGFLGANISYRLFSTYKHKILFTGGSLFTIFFVLFGQIMIEHVFQFQTTLGVILEFVGGVYFLYILLKERKHAI